MTYSHESAHSTQDRTTFAIERAKLLFGGYRRGDANDPETYVAAISAVLACYDVETIKRVTDPRTGISTHEKFRAFMPNSGELKAFCDDHQAIVDRGRRYAALPPPVKRLPKPQPRPGDMANVLVRSGAPMYAKMVERTQDADPLQWRWDEDGRGLWVALAWIDDRAAKSKTWKSPEDLTVSPLLQAILQPEPEPIQEAAE